MVSIPATAQNINLVQTRIATLETENRALKQQLSWERRLFSNPHISASQKLALWGVVGEIDKTAPTTQQLTPVNITYVSKKIGMSPKTTGRNLAEIAEANGLTRQAENTIDGSGQVTTVVYFARTPQTARPQEIIPLQPRNHGGARAYCKDCGSENLLEQKTIICANCGSVQHTSTKPINADPPPASQDDRQAQDIVTEQKPTLRDEPLANLSNKENQKEPMDNLTTGEKGIKPATPQEIAALLFDIAGDQNEHIIMSRGAKKYITIHGSLTENDLLAHLAGEKTIGAALKHADGTTRALCFDADNAEAWQQLTNAASLLVANGYKPILEVSPAGRGGHLWIIFSERINARAAYIQVCSIAPSLKGVTEYWPRPGNQKVRLPAGKYVGPNIEIWTCLYDAAGNEISKSDLLTYQTPAQIVPAIPEPEAPQAPQNCATLETAADHSGVDETWLAKYGKSNLWFAWTEKQLAAWYNEQTSVYDLLPAERNGAGLSTWRGERTASVVFRNPDIWVDFGAGAQRPDGKQDGGDCLELTTRIEQKPKREVMREIGRALAQEAKAALENAARNGEQPPAWLLPFITLSGWQHYEEIKAATWGVAGFYSQEPEQADPTTCIECGDPSGYGNLYCPAHGRQKDF